MKYAMLLLLVAVSAFAGAMDIYVDCEAENKLDIVFVIDTSGASSTYFSSLVWNSECIDSLMEYCDIHWGIVTFADSVDGDHDYDPTNPGIDLTPVYSRFRADIVALGSSGGGDAPEEALDALWVAANSTNWRSEANRVIFLITDAVFCESSDSSDCSSCKSNLTKEDCLEMLMDHDIALYPIISDTLTHGACVPLPPYHYEFWEHAADTTGGEVWSLDGYWRSLMCGWADSIGLTSADSIYITNNTGFSVDAEVHLSRINCGWVYPPLLDMGSIPAGDTGRVGFYFLWNSSYSKCAFHVIGDFDGGAYVETLLVTLDSCGCHEAVVEFERGWNAVSLPSDYAFVPLSRFETAIGDAFLYDAAVGDYEATDILAPGMGYWVLSDDSVRIMFAGEPIDGIWMPTFRGWNLLGGGSLPFYATEGESMGAPIWPMFEFLDGEYEPADIIEIGKGYWLLEDASGRWEAP